MNNIIKSGFPRIVCRLIMVLLLAGMCHYGTMANETLPKSTGIGEEYNPDSPGNPGENPEETEKTYRLTVVANPSGAGYVSAGSSELKAGERTNIYCSNNSGFEFKNCTIEGKEVSNASSFEYVMPEYDVTIVANFIYNPANPGNPSPEEQKVKHPVVIRAIPSGAASFSPSKAFDMEENSSRTIYAYPNSGWHLTGWTINGEKQPQTTSPLEITMGEKALDIAAYFSYNPAPPANPGANYYNPTTGQVIIDDFTPGYLYDALSNLVGYDDNGSVNFSNISSLIVKGQLTSNDLGNINYLTNTGTIDLSRTGGLTSIPSYTFSSASASNIVLPSTITSIGNYAFENCANLASLTLYAQEPPACDSYTFSNFTNKNNCTVYVPASAIELYSNAEYWKDFTILPISNDAHVLQINLPADASDGRYKNNSIELVNINTGVRQKYVISDRLLYTFNGLQKDEQYNIYMFSQAGLEIGRIENVVIPDQDISVTFDNLKSLHTVFAKVLASDDSDVTSQVTVEWIKPLADGTTTYLRKAVSLGEIPEGQQLICRVSLDNKLGVVYTNPEDVEFTVGSDNNTCIVNLIPFRAIELSGSVVDGEGTALSGVSVSVNQTLNGKFSKTYTAKTDRKGQWNLSVLDAPETRLTYAASECVNVNDAIGAFAADVKALDLGKTTMKSIVGARVSYGFTYHAAGSDDVQDYYSDYQNVAISVFNVTQNRAHKEVSLQYPILAVLDENINAGDELKLTATSKTGAFNPIVETVTVGDNQRAEVTFDIVGKGGISASFEMTENPAVIAMLYTGKGELLKKMTYSEAKATFTELEDGDYTLVSMGQSDLMNSILRLSNFAEIGLTEGKDYVKNAVKVETGQLAEVKISEVPAFDESLFYYTNSTTSFSSNKSSITTGNYLTLRSAIDFKGVYKNDISNVALIVDLPEACDFVEQSVIQGPNLLPYTLDNNRLTVQLGNNYQSQTRFCVIPTTGGSFNATASIVFDYNGKTITQPIGSAASEIKELELTVPKTIAFNSFKVSGITIAQSSIEIFENNEVIGKGKSISNGNFKIECTLDKPYNLSTHDIYALITTPSGNVLKSESKEVIFDKTCVNVQKVIMTEGSNRVVFDFENPDSENKYYYYTFGKFTFVIEFNSPKAVTNTILYVHTTSGNVVALPASYDAQKDVWFASAEFETSSLPLNVSVDFDADTDFIADDSIAKDLLADFSGIQDDLTIIKQLSDSYLSSLEESPDLDFLDFINEVDNSSSEDIDEIIASMSEDELVAYIDEFVAQDFSDIKSDEEFDAYFNHIADLFSFQYGQLNLDNGISVITSKLSEIGIETIDLESYISLEDNNGNNVYYYQDENTSIYIDISNDLYIEMSITTKRGARRANAVWEASNLIIDAGDRVLGAYKDLQDKIVSLTAHIEAEFISLTNRSKDLSVGCKALRHRIAYYENKIAAGTADPWDINDCEELKSDLKVKKAKLNSVNRQLKLTKALRGPVKWLGPKLNKICPIIKYINLISSGTAKITDFVSLYNGLPRECPADPSGLIYCQNLVKDNGWFVGKLLAGHLTANVLIDIAAATQIIGGAATGGTTLLTGFVTAVTKMAIGSIIDFALNKTCTNKYNEAYNAVQSLKCVKDCGVGQNPPCPKYPTDNGGSSNGNGKTGPGGKGGDHKSGNTDTKYGIDPSGYVYEAVPTNRVEGVQAAIYYKETKEDMYGDPYEEIILWDAEEYAQKNPLFTDANGMYQWDVPQGLWQVKFEKDGYQTAYSEWLPVPPPQLEVNIGIVQNKQPEVTEARAYEEGVELQFDKYMDLSTLTTANIYVTANGEKLTGEIHLIDSALADEYADENDADAIRYASRIRFVPAEKLSATTGEIRVTVSRNVLSYAGIPMTETFSQVLDVEKEVQMIVADDVKVLYGGEKEITVYAMPYEAAVGRKLHIANSSDLIASTDLSEATLDDEGKAVVKVKGELPGRSQLTFSIEDVTATGSAMVDVVTEIITAEAPKSSRASGTAVYRGTKIVLSTESKDATIYFTTDGSCPCDENGTRRKYTVPIVINDDTKILAMTSVGNGDEDVSETVELNYTLKHSDMDFQMPAGWTWMSHNFESAIAASELTADEGVARILSQTQEIIRDPQLGLVGSLSELSASESYKVETTTATARQRLSDIAWNPATPIAVNAGWNWLGYPVSQTMSVDEAFAPTAAETLDVVVGQNGFAQFDGEKWVGTLETMSPGMGYMYQSQSAKNVVYNTSIVSNASAKYAPGISGSLPLVLDIHKYGVIMPLVATLGDNDGLPLNNEDYLVAAFCGTECRGIARVVDGLVMMNVYGNVKDKITFRVSNLDGETDYANNAGLTFSETVVGDIFNPYVIAINAHSGMADVKYDGNIEVWTEGDMLRIKGIAADDIDLVEVYDTNGQKLIRETNVSESGIRISTLTTGVYVVIVNGNGEYTYHKVAVR